MTKPALEELSDANVVGTLMLKLGEVDGRSAARCTPPR